MARRATLSYDLVWYTPSNLVAMLEGDKALVSQVRKEYTRLRDISQKRLKRLAKAGFSDTEVYKRNVNHYPKLKDIKTKHELAARLSDLSRFVASAQSTVSGIKEKERKSLESLSDHGYGFVNESNLQEFGDFMEEYRNQLLDMDYDSGDAAELYNVVIKHKLDPSKIQEDFELWLENLEEAQALRRSKTDGNYEKTKKRLEKKIEENKKIRREQKRNDNNL